MSNPHKRAFITKNKVSWRGTRVSRSSGPSGKVRIVDVSGGGRKVVYDQNIPAPGSRKTVLEKLGPSLSRAMRSAAYGSTGVDLIIADREELDDEPGMSVGSKRPAKAMKKYWHDPRADAVSWIRTDTLIDRMIPDAPVPTPAQALQAQRNSEARWALMQEFGAYTSEEIAEHRSRAKNRHALANRWRSEGKVLSVDFHGQRLFPGFQFDLETHAPRPVVADALAVLPRDEMSEWEVALWWASPNGWLGGARPVDVMGGDEEAVVKAASHLAEPSPL
jgi:hypothetical protein